LNIRKVFRWLVILAVLTFTVFQSIDVVHNFRNWRESVKIGDRSAADLYQLNVKVDCGEVLVAWGFAGVLVYLLRSKKRTEP
jgi:hypothetical protein